MITLTGSSDEVKVAAAILPATIFGDVGACRGHWEDLAPRESFVAVNARQITQGDCGRSRADPTRCERLRGAARSISSSVFVGSGTLAIRCAQLAMAMGHVIGAALCGDAVFAEWATRANIPCMESVEELSSFLKAEPVDWIFSVANPFILPPDVFGRVRRGAFNYHDGPLPRYAGTHATSWALLAQETEYAITWYRIDDGVDTGDVVIQRQVLTSPTDTALTLNLKCYEAAIEGFRELLTGLENGKLGAYPQALVDRSYFPRHRRPDAAGCLRWDQSGQELSAMTRALGFGPYQPNPMCLPKALVGDQAVTVRHLEMLARRSGVPAGSLLEVHSSHWRVATGTEDVDVCFGGSDGQELDARALARHSNLDEGSRLPILSNEQARSITATHEFLAPREDFWRQRLGQFRIFHAPFLSSSVAVAPPGWQSSSWFIPSALAKLSPLDHTEYLVTAWLVCLARITGETELQLGWTPASGGSKAGSKAVEVLIASVVPMEVAIDLAHDFEEMRKTVAAEFAQLRAHASFARDLIARYPTLRGVEALRSHQPWPIGITITTESCSVAGDLMTSHRAGPALCGNLLTFEVCALDGSFRWHFDASRLAPKQIDRMTQHLQTLLHAVMADAGQPVGRIDILPAVERTYLLEELNRMAAAYPSERCIHELFEAQVQKAPEAVAVVHENERLGYGELNARANRLAHHLIALGVRPDQPVAICLERSLAMVVGVLAILKAGGAYLPLDPAYPSARLRQIVGDAEPRLLLCDAAGRIALGAEALADVSVVDLDTATPARAKWPPSDPEPRTLGLTSRHLAYVNTSGSTGTPKGVEMSHGSLVNSLAGVGTSKRRTFQFATLNFDVSYQELFICWKEGGVLVLVREETRGDFSDLLDFVKEEAIERFFLPFVALNHFAEVWGARQVLLPSLSEIYTAGEQLQATPLLRAFFEAHPKATLINQYGSTEINVIAEHRLTADPSCWPQLPPVGRPIANTRVYLLDGYGAPVPFGAVGELCIGGAGVARGYLTRPELTAERFIASPFVDGDRLYRTGDLAGYLPDGNLEFLGRNDDQVKIRGFRIEPGEIAARLCEHAWVRETAVVAHEDRAGDRHLIAYVVFAPEAGSDEDDGALAGALRAHLGARLPDYMVPAAFVPIAALPLTPNGKLDRKALPAPGDEAYARRSYEAPQGEVETALAEIWAELLGVERIGRHDNFFELGGHSLLAVQVLSRALDLRLNFSAADLFQASVLKELASKIHLEPQPSSPGVISVRPTGSQPLLFFVPTGFGDCSYVLGLVEEMDVDCPVYALPWPPFNDVCPPSLEAIAAEAILAIREIQPRDPYRFAEYSSSAIVAYAIAHHLLSLDEAVSFMAFIDVTIPATLSNISPINLVRKNFLERCEILHDDFVEVLECFDGQRSIAELLKKAQQMGALPPDHDLRSDVLMYQKAAQFHRALQSYRVPSLPIEIHQFYAGEPLISRWLPPDKQLDRQANLPKQVGTWF
ncbi:amino acid adenylation domain-containing protein [Mesorhizobium tamadayense]|nr:amino acid adenylation domain-containing protein [Mesorhizobium tamadayense]